MIPSNLGQIIGHLMYPEQPEEQPRAIGRVQKKILELLGGEQLPCGAKLIAEKLEMKVVNVCCALQDMTAEGMVVRTGTRGKFLYALKR